MRLASIHVDFEGPVASNCHRLALEHLYQLLVRVKIGFSKFEIRHILALSAQVGQNRDRLTSLLSFAQNDRLVIMVDDVGDI